MAVVTVEIPQRFWNVRHASRKVKVEKVSPNLVLEGLVAQNKNCHYCHHTATKKGGGRGELPRVIKQDALARPKHEASVPNTVRKASVLLKGAQPTCTHGGCVSSTVRTVSALRRGVPPTHKHGASVTDTVRTVSALCRRAPATLYHVVSVSSTA